jgi:MFS family permease
VTGPRATLAIAAIAHFLHDGFADIIFVLLPVWAAEYGLTLAQVGLIRTSYVGAMSLLQVPAGLLAERWGERPLLAAGTAVTAAGYLLVGTSAGFAALLVLLLLAGAGSGVQHPLASSLVSQAFETGRRRAALGTYNFAGDLGKIASAAGIAAAAALFGWRASTMIAGLIGLAAALVMFVVLGVRRTAHSAASAADETIGGGGWGIRDARGFRALAAVGMIDNSTRTALLTFLPFALIAKGTSVAGVGVALALVFAGGAIGKFVCGFIAERAGVIRTVILTESLTAIGIVTVIVAPQAVALAVLFPLGVALNGTSSVLYATVADLVAPDRRSRAYGLYYTLSLGASALAPTVYGLIGDAVGVPVTLTVVSLIVLTTIPLCLVLRPAVEAPAAA